MARVLDPQTQYSDDGEPVVAGSAYFGLPNTDPTQVVNQIPIFSDRACTIPLAQPVLTDAQGRLTTAVYVAVNEYSYQVFDALNNQLLDEPLLEPLNVQGLVTADIDMNGFKHINVGEATANNQYATLGYVNKTFGMVLETDGTSAADAIVVDYPVALATLINGVQFYARITHGPNTVPPTVQILGFPAKSAYRGADEPLIEGDTGGDGYICHFVYDLSLDKFALLNPKITSKINTYYYTANDTYTPHPNTKYIEITAVGAGGGAGGVDGQGGGDEAISGAGAGGGTAIKATDVIDAAYTIVVGSGGAGGAGNGGNDGANGGNTTVTSLNVTMVAGGGEGGKGSVAAATVPSKVGSNGGTASGGDINLSGGDGDRVGSSLTLPMYWLGRSGTSIFGGSRRGRGGHNDGFDAVSYGAGGGSTMVDDIASNYDGGDGADGIVIIKEYLA